MEDLQAKLIEWLAMYGTKILGAILIVIIGRIIAGMLSGLVGRLLKRSKIDETLCRFVVNLTRALLLTFVVIAAVDHLGVETTSFVAILGAAGLAVGLALRDSLSNFSAGVMLIIFRPFTIGDYVQAGGESGTVEEIKIFNTIMKSPDNIKLIIPNSAIISGTITNFSANDIRRVDMVFGIGYDDDLRKAKDLLNKLIVDDSRILSDPAPFVAVSELADSSVNFVVRPWTKTSDFWAVKCDFVENVKLTFDEAGISIPFPQQDIHLHRVATD